MKNAAVLLCLMSLSCIVFSQTKGSMTDPRDKQVYKTVKIGEQVWMAQNLNFATANSWCYEKDTANCRLYGRLYTYDDAMNSCPSGWHLPSDEEWSVLTDFLGGEDVAGLKMKGMDARDLNIPANSKVNTSGFSALAGGNRNNKNVFGLIGKYGCWWSSTVYSGSNIRSRYMTYTTAQFYSHFDNKSCGFSVRCVKD